MNEIIQIAQIGCGYWGPNLVRNFITAKNCLVKYIVENNEDRKKFINKSFQGITCVESYSQVLDDDDIDAIVIATPANLHFEQAKKALTANKHVFVEKPMATKSSEVQELSEIAKKRGLVLMSGHTFLYNDAVLFIKKEIESGNLGYIRCIYSQRLNLGRIRTDVDALWNFAPHDVSIIQFLLDDPIPLSVKAFGMDFIQENIHDVVFLNLKYDKTIANVHVSWLDPLKTRKLVVVGSNKMIVYDDVAEDKILVYDKGIDKFSNLGENMDFDKPNTSSFRCRSGDIWIPKLEYKEPLQRETNHFLDCISTKSEPLSGPTHTIRVIKILEMASNN